MDIRFLDHLFLFPLNFTFTKGDSLPADRNTTWYTYFQRVVKCLRIILTLSSTMCRISLISILFEVFGCDLVDNGLGVTVSAKLKSFCFRIRNNLCTTIKNKITKTVKQGHKHLTKTIILTCVDFRIPV